MRAEKKIVHIIESLKTGGAQRLISDLLPKLKNEGLKVELVVACLEDNILETKIKQNGILIVNLNSGSVRNKDFYKGLRLYLKSNASKIGLLHVHLFPTLYIVPMANIGTGIPLVYTEHSTSNKRRHMSFLRPIERIVYSRYNTLIGISDEVSAALSQWIGKHASNKIITIPNGVDLSIFQSTGTSQAVHRPKEKMILMVSRFVRAKDQETLIRSIPYVIDKKTIFCFAGEGETLDRHITLAKETGVADRCRFLGNVCDIVSLMRKATIGVQSSHWEGFGLTAIEFMAAGVPVIASDVPGLGNVVKGAGLLCKPHDPVDLAEKINLLTSDYGLYRQLKEKGAERCGQFSIQASAKRIAAEYQKLIGKGNR